MLYPRTYHSPTLLFVGFFISLFFFFFLLILSICSFWCCYPLVYRISMSHLYVQEVKHLDKIALV